AENLFHERGYMSTSVDAIAEALNFTKPFVYAVYRRKADILAEICQRFLLKRLELMEEANSLKASPSIRLHRIAGSLSQHVIDKPGSVSIFFRERNLLDTEAAEVLRALNGEFDVRMATLLLEGCRIGEFRVSDVNIASMAIYGLINSVHLWHHKSGNNASSVICNQVSDYALSLVSASKQEVTRPSA
ncbi:MAG: TetR/AcrR family transcriptional regulator, partial [Cytophagaceae bacterium]